MWRRWTRAKKLRSVQATTVTECPALLRKRERSYVDTGELRHTHDGTGGRKSHDQEGRSRSHRFDNAIFQWSQPQILTHLSQRRASGKFKEEGTEQPKARRVRVSILESAKERHWRSALWQWLCKRVSPIPM